VHPNQIAMQLFHHSMPPTPDDGGSTVSITAIREGGSPHATVHRDSEQ
jgi:hypothetical protein